MADSDMGLTSFLGVLPVSRALEPKLDIHPRRLDLGKLIIGDVRRVQFTLSNTGQGQLQGTLEDRRRRRLAGAAQPGQVVCHLAGPQARAEDHPRSQHANAGGPAKLRRQADRGDQWRRRRGAGPAGSRRLGPSGSPRFRRSRRRGKWPSGCGRNSKAAVPLLESGEVFRWFASNNWNYPVQGQQIKGMAGVQQFFEAMGLSKPPALSAVAVGIPLPLRQSRPDPLPGGTRHAVAQVGLRRGGKRPLLAARADAAGGRARRKRPSPSRSTPVRS